MPKVIAEKTMVEVEGSFVVFLIGMRVNKPWKVHKWLPVFLTMPRMLKELDADPDLGLLAHQNFPGMIVQYWRSFEHLEAYAASADHRHAPAMAAFYRRVGRTSGDVGIWHETYLVEEGAYEAVYGHMPPFGLGKAGRLVTTHGRTETARGRVRAGRA